jgi:alpha-ribazole phosphatase
MEIVLLRHGQTPGSAERRYVGATDEVMDAGGAREAIKSGIFPGVPLIYASPLLRCVQTARIKFPNARIVLCNGLREMNFGLFEGRSAAELEDDKRYRAWVDGDCFGQCPGGEGRIEFSARVCVAFAEIVGETIARRHRYTVVLAHGGTIMAIMERFARPHRPYFSWSAPHCGGFRAVLDEFSWGHAPILTEYEEV